LSPVALAFWIMCDGARNGKGLVLCTEGFSQSEVVCLLNILTIRYGLVCSIRDTVSGPRLYIAPKSMPLLRSIVTPHMVPFSMYKLAGQAR
jgi:hypothetical protein